MNLKSRDGLVLLLQLVEVQCQLSVRLLAILLRLLRNFVLLNIQIHHVCVVVEECSHVDLAELVHEQAARLHVRYVLILVTKVNLLVVDASITLVAAVVGS